MLAAAEELAESAPDYGQILDQLAALLERIALQQLVPDYAGDELFSMPLVRELAARILAEDVQLYYQTAIMGRRDLALAPDPRTGFRMTLIRMLAFRPEPAGPGRAVAPGPAPAPAPPPTAVRAMPAAAATAASVSTTDWRALVPALDLDGPAKMLALNCSLVARESGLLRLSLDPHKAAARTRGREDKLAQALSKYLGESVRVEISLGEVAAETPAQTRERATRDSLAAAHAALAADPAVRSLQERFGATVSPDSVRVRRPAP